MKKQLRKELTDLYRYRTYLKDHPALKSLFLELTDNCNLSCLHCGSSCSSANHDYLSVEDCRKVLLNVKDNMANLPMLCLTGGEPLLHHDFFRIIQMADELGYRWGMTSNATMLDEDTCRKLLDSHMYSLSISLDGMKEAHSILRNSTIGFDRTVQGIKNIVKAGKGKTIIQITSVISKLNIGQLEEICHLAEDLNVDSLRLINIEPMGRALDHPELLLEKEDYIRLFDFIAEKRKKPQAKMEITYGCSHYLGERYEGKLRDYYFLCGSGIYVGSVCANGDICGCLDLPRLPQLIQGNIAEDDFYDIWINRFANLRTDRSKFSSRCRNCSEKHFCLADSQHSYDFAGSTPLLCIKDMLTK